MTSNPCCSAARQSESFGGGLEDEKIVDHDWKLDFGKLYEIAGGDIVGRAVLYGGAARTGKAVEHLVGRAPATLRLVASFVYVDNSNVWIEGMRVSAVQRGLAPDMWVAQGVLRLERWHQV
jgi:hypothetical protein